MINIKLWYILPSILVFGFLIFIHELGHFLCARAFGVGIKEFAIGMGPKVFSWVSKKTEIRYSIRLLPFGGFVDMVGEDEESPREDAFHNKPVWQRILVVLAGPTMNLVIGFVAMAIMVSAFPPLASTVVSYKEETMITSPTLASGLCDGDKILKVGKVRVHTGNELLYEVMRQGVAPVDLLVERNGEKRLLEDVIFKTEDAEGMTVGTLDFYLRIEQSSFGNVTKHTFFRSFSTVKMVIDSFVDLLSGKFGIEAMSGPVGMTQIIGESVAGGAENFLYILAVITINLGVFNLFPIPALDGGRLLFFLIEAVTRRPLNRNVEGYIQFIGLVLLLGLAAVVMIQDVVRLF